MSRIKIPLYKPKHRNKSLAVIGRQDSCLFFVDFQTFILNADAPEPSPENEQRRADPQQRRRCQKIENTMKSCLKEDKAKIKVGKISRFGLMEMSRQRIRPSLESGNFVMCANCRGKGLTPSIESLSLGFLRKLRLETLKPNLTKVDGFVLIGAMTMLFFDRYGSNTDSREARHSLISPAGKLNSHTSCLERISF